MTRKQFENVVDRRIRLIKEVLKKKQAEYAHRGDNAFHNFEKAGRITGLSREMALSAMMAKHLVSIQDMIVMTWADGKVYPVETIEEKIGDAINYLILLEGMLKERR